MQVQMMSSFCAWIMPLLCLILCEASRLLAQVPTSADPRSYLMRMERVNRNQDSCILVRSDGQYHFETVTAQKASVVESTLSPDSLRDLIRLLSQDRLFRLQQKDIHTPMVSTAADELMLAVLRPVYVWQTLDFPTPESRDPFHDTIDPLLDWFERAHKQKGRNLSEEEGRNSCFVPGEIRLNKRDDKKVEHEGPPPTSPKVEEPKVDHDSSSDSYLLRWLTTRMEGNGIEGTCLIVFSSGTYHEVHQFERVGSKKLKSTVLDGTFPPQDLDSLRSILDDTELQKFSGPAIDRLRGEGVVTHLTIPRNGKVQQVAMWDGFNSRVWYPAQTISANKQGHKLLKPLTEWIKTKLPRTQEKDATDPPNPKCLATP